MLKVDPTTKEYEAMRSVIRTVQNYEKRMQEAISHEHAKNLENMMEEEVYNIIKRAK